MLGAGSDATRGFVPVGAVLVAGLLLSPAASASEAGPFRCVGAMEEPLACRVCLAPSDGGLTVCHRDGTRFDIPAGTYGIRAEAGNRVLGTDQEIHVPGATSEPSPPLRLVPGGRVRITGSRPGLAAIRVISLSTRRADTLRLGGEQEVAVPSGTAVAYGIAKDGSVTGLTRPWIQRVGETVTLPDFEEPKPGRGHLLVRSRSAPTGQATGAETSFALRDAAERSIGSGASGPSGNPVAVFYDVPAGDYDLAFASPHWLLEGPVDVRVRAGQSVVKNDVSLVARPSLDVIVAPLPWTPAAGWSLTLYVCAPGFLDHPGPAGWPDLDECRPGRNAQFRGDSTTLVDLDPGYAFAVLEGDGRKLGQPVELVPGNVSKASFEFRATRLKGQVMRAGTPAAARITFEPLFPSGSASGTDTDPNGKFEQPIWTRGLVRLKAFGVDQDSARARQVVLDVEGEPELHVDIELGWTDASVRVVAADTGSPVPGAVVSWVEEGSGRRGTTDDSGEFTLPALPPGETKLLVKADGYRPQLQEIAIEDTEAPQSFDVALDRQRDENSFTAVLADGAPAAFTTIFVGAAADERAECDASGRCRLAARPREDQTIFGFAKRGGLTVASAGGVFASGRLELGVPGGDLVVVPHRGPATARSTLKIVLSVDGVPLPDGLLGSMAMNVPRSYQIYAFPGASDQFIVVGLREGAISGQILARPRDAPAEAPFTPVVEPMSWELPTSAPAVVELP